MAQDPDYIGKYQILGQIGRGGMGAVYKGFDPAIRRHVAIKAIDKSSLEEAELAYIMARFRHEVQAVGRLVHPRIIAVYDYGEDGNYTYIVMELVEGKSLFEHLKQGATYDLREVAEIIRQLLDPLGYFHAQGVVHRDVKPSNILINSDGRIKLGDFGIASIEASELTRLGDVLGTSYYMAPEQFLGTAVDALADLYSVGVIAYELLTGQKPFVGPTAVVMQKVLNEAPRDPSELNPVLGPELNAVILKALAKKPEDRFSNAREFSEAFRQAIEASLYKESGVTEAPAAPRAAPGLARAARMIRTTEPSMAARSAAPGVAPPAAALSGKKARILFVDDEERILTALKSIFRPYYHVFTTVDGRQGLDFLKKYPVEVVVSDQRMPEMLGVELLREAKQIAPQTVRILLTGYSDLAAIVGSINDGEIYRFISKPWDNKEIQRIVAEAATIAFALADMPANPAGLPGKMDEAILVVDDNESVFRATREFFSSTCGVRYAKTLKEALRVMQEHPVAVVLADVETGHQDNTLMFKLLKQEFPQILTIVMTRNSDAELVIDLINQAQIFRFLNKPVNLKLLQGHAQAALARYASFKQQPALLAQHKVEAVEQVRASSPGQMILSTLKSVGSRWFSAAPK
jgi:response regulator RpfG family c-di-GMP phosphodiesterase